MIFFSAIVFFVLFGNCFCEGAEQEPEFYGSSVVTLDTGVQVMHDEGILMYSPSKQHYFTVSPTQTRWVCSEDAWLAQASAHRYSESSTKEQLAQEHEQRITPRGRSQGSPRSKESTNRSASSTLSMLCCKKRPIQEVKK